MLKALACGAPSRQAASGALGGTLKAGASTTCTRRARPRPRGRNQKRPRARTFPPALRTWVEGAGVLRGGQAGGAGSLSGPAGGACVVCAGGLAVYAGEGCGGGEPTWHGSVCGCVAAAYHPGTAQGRLRPAENTARPRRRPSTPSSVPGRSVRTSRVWSVQGVWGERVGAGAPSCWCPQDEGFRRPPCGLRVYGVA